MCVYEGGRNKIEEFSNRNISEMLPEKKNSLKENCKELRETPSNSNHRS